MRASSGKFGAAQEWTLAGEDYYGSVAKFGACGGCLLCGIQKVKYCEEFEVWFAGCRHISTFKLGAGKSFGVRNEEDEGLLGSCGDLKHLKR